MKSKEKRVKRRKKIHSEFLEFFSYIKKNINKLNPAILDIETTGIRRKDEILQITIIDLMGNKLFNKYIKPKNATSWEEALKIHNISYEDIENKKHIGAYRRIVEKILKKHKLIIGYQVHNDIAFLQRALIDCSKNLVFDLSYPSMLLFKNQNLTDKLVKPSLVSVSKYYNYEFEPHNALNDCRATLHILKKILIEKEEMFKLEIEENVEKKEEVKLSKLEKLAKKYVNMYNSYNNKIILDLETTGVNSDDEIIQLSIINLEKEVLFDQYIKPMNKTSWEEATKIHKITPEMLKDKLNIEEYREEIQKILDDTEIMIGYGIDFDYKKLKEHNFNVEHIKRVDISEYFKYLYREILKDLKAKRPRLVECSSYYGFKSDNYHNSLTDCYATLVSYNGIYKDMEEIAREL